MFVRGAHDTSSEGWEQGMQEGVFHADKCILHTLNVIGGKNRGSQSANSLNRVMPFFKSLAIVSSSFEMLQRP